MPKGERLSSGSETERLDKGRLSRERNNAGAALYNLSDIFASLDATSPDKGRLCGGEVLSQHRVLLRNEISLPMAPLSGKTPPAGGGGTKVPKGERLSSGSETERLDKGHL